MSTTLKLRIETREEMERLMRTLQEKKLVPEHCLEDDIQAAVYPIDVPVRVDSILDVVCKPMVVKMFGNQLRPALVKGLATAMKGT